jgi:hypothetical protein
MERFSGKENLIMLNIRGIALATLLAFAGVGSVGLVSHAQAASAEDLNRDSDRVLQKLYDSNPAAAVRSPAHGACRRARSPTAMWCS